MQKSETVHTETHHNPDGSVTTVTIVRKESQNQAEIITTTQNTVGMSVTTTQTVTLHTEHSS